MTAGTLGPVAIWAAMVLSLLAVITGRRRWLMGAAALSVVATVVLGVALVTGDFSLEYVARTTSLATPWPYRLAALWGGMDGSMLFYSTLTLVVAALGLRSRPGVRVGSAVGLGLLVITLIFANPFFTPELPAVDGDGLLAILQHPAMIYHPPILYLGLVVLVVPFARTLGMVYSGEDRSLWLETSRRWLYISWTLLVLGMAAGANWAYVELGWGGYWAWDPVENTSLMPWLAITVFLHTSRVEEPGGRMRRWNVLFAALPFVLTVVGIYLTRSGVTGSIHSFAEDPVVGRILLVAAAFIAGMVAMMTARSEAGRNWGRLQLNRHGWLAINAVIVSGILVFVTAGSVYPAVASLFFGDNVAVDSRYFVMTVLPLAVLAAGGIALSLRGSTRLYLVLATVVALVVVAVGGLRTGAMLLVPAAASVAAIGIMSIRRRPRGRLVSAHLAHFGMAVVLVGVAGSSFGSDFSGPMMSGDTRDVGGHEVTLLDIASGETERYVFVRATFDVDGSILTPEIRAYEDQLLPVAEPVLRSSVVDDVVVAVSLLFPDGETVAVSVFVRPLVWWVWVGAALIGLAGLIALFARDGAAAAPRRPATGEPQPEGTTTGIAPR